MIEFSGGSWREMLSVQYECIIIKRFDLLRSCILALWICFSLGFDVTLGVGMICGRALNKIMFIMKGKGSNGS